MADLHALASDLHIRPSFGGLGVVGKGAGEVLAGLSQQHPVLRPARSSERWLDGAEVQFQILRIHRLGAWIEPQTLFAGIRLHQGDLILIASCESQIVQGGVVDGEYGNRAAVFRTHVADGRSIGERHS